MGRVNNRNYVNVAEIYLASTLKISYSYRKYRFKISLKGGFRMKEQLYTIPVNDGFNQNCECPLCAMHKTLEDRSIEYTMGASYMEDDVRAETDKMGFCDRHARLLYKNQNRLGLALMLQSHLAKTNRELEELSSNAPAPVSTSFFKKKSTGSVKEYINKIEHSCFVCDRICNTFERYIVTIFQLYKTDVSFVGKLKASKGLCTAHFGLLYDEAPNHLSGEALNQFVADLNQLYLSNMKRVKEDLDWFVNKFDYRFADEPWKDSKDALQRTLLKTNGIIDELE